ncbi:MAG: peptide ABC transporter ATP-binding protein, partial [Nocardioidaceae bacterium]
MSARRRAAWLGVLRTPMGGSAAVLLAVVLLLAVLAPVLWTGNATAVDTNSLSQGSSADHWVGTDHLGR